MVEKKYKNYKNTFKKKPENRWISTTGNEFFFTQIIVYGII